MDSLSQDIRKLASWPLAGFVVLCIALTYWQVIAAPSLNSAKENNRAERMQRRIQPGRLLTEDGLVILDSRPGQDGWERVYPDTEAFCHLTGYNNRSGLQKTLSDVLYAQGVYGHPLEDLLHGEPIGNDVYLTINAGLQQIADRMMDGRRGAVIAMDPRDGRVLCLYSSPTYEAASVTSSAEAYNVFSYDPSKPELNRALQGMYPPGSVFKIFTASAAVDAGIANPATKLHCKGTERIGGTTVKCRRLSGHGELSMEWAMADSCNIAFAKLGDEIGPERFREYVRKFHLLDAANLPLPTVAGRMADFLGYKGELELVEASFGQGKTLVTPLAIARLTATIANGGEVVQPLLIEHVNTSGGRTLTRGSSTKLGRAVSKETADAVAGMMRAVVEDGTGAVVDLAGTEVAAKTGSAQNPSGDAHAWFTCFAPYEAPTVVVTVMIENGGSGSETAGPIAAAVLKAALEYER